MQSNREKVYQYRQLGWKYKDIAKELGISHQRVHQIYTGYGTKDYKKGEYRFCNFETWDEFLKHKSNSLYYEFLVKQYGKDKAEYIWDCRNFTTELNIWSKVKNYKPKDPLCLVDEGNQLWD